MTYDLRTTSNIQRHSSKMKTIRFTACSDGYRCSEPGDQSGEYVKREDVQSLLDHTAWNEKKAIEILMSGLSKIVKVSMEDE